MATQKGVKDVDASEQDCATNDASECRQRVENAMTADETHQETLKRRDERWGRHKEQVPEEVPPEAGPSTPRLPEDLEIVNDVSAEDEPVNDEDSESGPASRDSSSDSSIDSSEENESIVQSVAKKQRIQKVQRGNLIIDSEASEIISRKQRTQ